MPTLQFKGKSFVKNHHLSVSYHQLIPEKERSFTEKVSLHDNLIINGDNLLALKALLPTYSGKIKCIYIDPPYNTGNENWKYNDNVNSPMMKEWFGNVVDKEDLSRHDKWLCMMYPRLNMLKQLLKEDGVIFVSIDDNEFSSLKLIMDEIFGEENFVATFVWKRRASSAMADKLVSKDHEYVLCYQKSEFNSFSGVEKDFKSYSNPDNDPRGDWTKGDLTVGMTKEQRPNQYYELIDPETGSVYKANPQRVWAYIPDSMESLIKEGRIIFPDSDDSKPMFKRYKDELRISVNPISTWITDIKEASKSTHDKVTVLGSGLNSEGTKVVQDIFGAKVFDYPKPPSLIKALIKQVCQEDDIILDSFAGSGTTAQAVLELNKEDGGNRKFILVEMEDYANDITAERIRRIIKKDNEKQGLFYREDGFSFFTLGNAIEMNNILSGSELPTYEELSRYLFFTSTGEEFDENLLDKSKNFIGSTNKYDVFLFYKPDIDYLKTTALTLEKAKSLPINANKRRLVFAPMKFLEQDYLDRFGIDFVQLPYEIYKIKG